LNSAILDDKEQSILGFSDDEELNGRILVCENPEGCSHVEVRKHTL
jgi:hypothetical protein